MTVKPKIPVLPSQYVDRVDERQAIEGLLRDPGKRVAVYGLPGMGKTAMAAKVAGGARDSLQVDTVLWADLGQEADPVDVLRGWCQDLKAEVSAGTGTPEEQLEYLQDRLSDAASGQYVLFVLDDVGSSPEALDAASACLIDDENCRYLVTTISSRTAGSFARDHHFDAFRIQELDDPKAGLVLERYAEGKISLEDLSDAQRMRLLRLGDGLPLGLMVLGRFLDQGLEDGDTLPDLLGKLDSAEALVQQNELGVRLRAGRDVQRGSIDTILMARWASLPPDQQEALQTAAVFRGKPHAFAEAAWAGILGARRAPLEGAEEPEELAQTFGQKLAKIEDPGRTDGLDTADDGTRQVIQALKRLAGLRAALMRTGLIEQPVVGVPSFTMHSLIAAFLRTIPGLDESELKREFTRVHGLAARYYRGWLASYQEKRVASPFKAAYRLENRQWLDAMLDLCYHVREAGNEDEAVLLLATLFFDAFWWWGELVPYPLCDELLRMWQLAHLGDKASECLSQLHEFNSKYPVIALDLVPPENPLALPSGYQDSTHADDFRAVCVAVEDIRAKVLNLSGVDDAAAERDRARLRMLTAIYLGESHRVMGQVEQAAQAYDEALNLLTQLGQGDDDSDDWIIPYVYTEVADLHVRAGDPAKVLDACAQGTQAAVDDGEMLEENLSESDIDNEALGWLWLAAGDAHWKAGRLPAAWRSYAWACFHACTAQVWPKREVMYERPGGVPERKEEFGVDDYTVTCYKVHLATMLDRLGELWTKQRRTEAREGVRIIRETLAGGPDKPGMTPDGKWRFDEVAAVRPEATWEDCRADAWHDTGLAGLALPLIPWERLVGADGRVARNRVADQRKVAQDLAVRLEDIWAGNKWALGEGPGQQVLPLDADATGAVEPRVTGVAE